MARERKEPKIKWNAAWRCAWCKHHIGGTFTCKAFPDGIPEEVLAGEADHSKPYPGDHGIQYEPED
ncbi:MAG: hypothetical protein HFF09_06560 [Oscillospiraceae bacterium]|nr:hypothetical protein [Oscillospiraceae bacterium]